MKKFHFDLIVSSVVLVAMIVVILIQIIFRLMGNPLSWTEEVAAGCLCGLHLPVPAMLLKTAV